MGFGARKDQAPEDAATIARVRETLEGYHTSTGPGATVSVTHVLDLLNPRGLWSLDPQRRNPQPAQTPIVQEPVPGADPLTGCKPVSAPGT